MQFWYELKINADSDTLAVFEEQVVEHEQVLAVTISPQHDEEKLFKDPSDDTVLVWSDNCLTLLVATEEAVLSLIGELGLLPNQYDVRVFQQQDWIAKSRDLFKPKLYGNSIYLHPSWCDSNEAYINICLDPGMAFGTGEHETTTLCLEWLVKHYDVNQYKHVLDYGSGTGVLAMAAAKLGAQKVDAVDIDPQAVLACEQNCEQNHLTQTVASYSVQTHQTVDQKYDLVLANILARPLIQLKETFANAMNDDAVLVVSGILAMQRDWLVESYADQFELKASFSLNDWLCLSFIKKI